MPAAAPRGVNVTTETSSAASILASRRAIRISSTHSAALLLLTTTAAAVAPTAAKSACGLALTVATAWAFMTGSPAALSETAHNGQGDYPQNWYDQGRRCRSQRPGTRFHCTFDVWFATRTGTTFNDITCGYNYSGSAGPVHVDQHALAFLPGSSSILLLGNDGGTHGTSNANTTTSTVDPTWFNMDTGLNTIEFYAGDISGNFANAPSPLAVGGAQDNAPSSVTFAGTPTGPVLWQTGLGGDGFSGQIDPMGTSCTQAQGTITVSAAGTVGQQFVVGTQTFTWVATRVNPGEVSVGTSSTSAATNIVTAITADIPSLRQLRGLVRPLSLLLLFAAALGI